MFILSHENKKNNIERLQLIHTVQSRDLPKPRKHNSQVLKKWGSPSFISNGLNELGPSSIAIWLVNYLPSRILQSFTVGLLGPATPERKSEMQPLSVKLPNY